MYIPSFKYSDNPVLLIELIYNHDVNVVIEQIRRQKYLERLAHYKGNILIIGINYDKDVLSTDPEFKHHSCMIEKA